MSDYTYAAISVPMLHFDQVALPFSVEKYENDCQVLLNERDAAMVKAVNIHNPEDLSQSWGPLESYRAWELTLRNELAKMRSRSLGISEQGHTVIGATSAGVESIAQSAFSNANPLEAEEKLNQERWRVLEFMKSGHQTDEVFMGVYKLQLQIIERKLSFDAERGNENFQNLYNNILESYQEGNRG